METGQRIKAARLAIGLSQEDFGDKLGLKKSAISLIENGRNSAQEQTIRAICREYRVDYDWLKTGVGEMFSNASEESLDALDDLMTGDDHVVTQALIKALASLDDKQLDVIDALIERIKKELG